VIGIFHSHPDHPAEPSGFDQDWALPYYRDVAGALALGMTRNTQPANYYGVPAVTLPLPRPAGALPVGVQVVGHENGDADVLAIALALARGGWSHPAHAGPGRPRGPRARPCGSGSG